MTRRHTSGFDILGFDTDPTPGDPDLIMSQIVPTYQSIGDDAEAALNALNSNAVENGAGQTMQALQNLIGTSYPPKLQTAADSYHSAASIYTTYAQALTDAQSQLDRAMDQAGQVAALANTTVQPAPPSASADQVAAVQQQQQSVNQANDQLTAAKQLAQDAQDMRTQAGNTFNTNLDAVSAIPAPTPPSWWQNFLNFFEHNPIIQILVDVAIAIVSIFCPVVGLALGLVAFGAFTAFNTIATGHFDIGAFVVGLATLAFGGLVAGGVINTVKVFSAIARPIAKAGEGVGSFFSSGSGTVVKGITASVKSLTNAVPKSVLSFAKNAGGNFAWDSVTGLGSAGIGDAIDHKQFTGQDAGAIVAGAAVGGVVAGGAAGAKTVFGFDPPAPEQPPPVPPKDPGMEPPPPTPVKDNPELEAPPAPPKGPRPMSPPQVPPKDSDPPQVPSKDYTGGAVDKPLPLTPTQQTIGKAIDQAGRLGDDVASGGVQIAVGQALGNTTGAQQDPPGVQAGQDAVSDLPALADGSNLNPSDIIKGITAPFKE